MRKWKSGQNHGHLIGVMLLCIYGKIFPTVIKKGKLAIKSGDLPTYKQYQQGYPQHKNWKTLVFAEFTSYYPHLKNLAEKLLTFLSSIKNPLYKHTLLLIHISTLCLHCAIFYAPVSAQKTDCYTKNS